jgi:hypothetical protein
MSFLFTECESYYDLCDYEHEYFNVECFGDCGRYDPFHENSMDLSNIWEDCGGENTLDCDR